MWFSSATWRGTGRGHLSGRAKAPRPGQARENSKSQLLAQNVLFDMESLSQEDRERPRSPGTAEKCQRDHGAENLWVRRGQKHRARNLLASIPKTLQLLPLHKAFPKTLSQGRLMAEVGQKGLWIGCQKPLFQVPDLRVTAWVSHISEPPFPQQNRDNNSARGCWEDYTDGRHRTS